jgi:hypothetical protein
MEANGRPGLGTQAQAQQLELEEMIVNAYVFPWVRDRWTQNKGTLGLNMSRAHWPTTSDHALPCTCCCSLATLLLTVDSTGFRKRDIVEVEHLPCVTDAHTTCTTPLIGRSPSRNCFRRGNHLSQSPQPGVQQLGRIPISFYSDLQGDS